MQFQIYTHSNINTQILNIKGKSIGFKSFVFCFAFYNKYLTHHIHAVRCVVENARYKMSVATNKYICSKREQTQHAAAALIRKPCLFPHVTNDSVFSTFISVTIHRFFFIWMVFVYSLLSLKISYRVFNFTLKFIDFYLFDAFLASFCKSIRKFNPIGIANFTDKCA